ncbi:MAG: DUF1572 family protein [Phycisphaerales bacterium]
MSDNRATPSNLVLASAITAFLAHKHMAERGIAQLDDQQLRQPLDPETNSIAINIKHIAGNLTSRWTDFLTSDGEKPWRDRDSEFVDTFKDREAMLTCWNAGWDVLLGALGSIDDADLDRTIMIRGEAHSVALALTRSLAHTAYHVGQIVLIARIHAGDHWTTLSIPRGQSEAYNQKHWGPGGKQ